MSNKIYLAVPYSHGDPRVRQERYEIVTDLMKQFKNLGYIVYSPITMTHPVDGGEDTEFWTDYHRPFATVCDQMIIIGLPGWDKSRGVTQEAIDFATEGKPVSLYLPMDYRGEVTYKYVELIKKDEFSKLKKETKWFAYDQ